VGRAIRIAAAVPSYARLAWWGLVTSRRERAPLTVHQGVIVGDAGVVLAMRAELRGWELPGGAALPGESGEAALRREVAEETGLAVETLAHVGDYCRSGFRPHTARVYRCRVSGGALRASPETPAVAWFDPNTLPRGLFPWFRGPLADAIAELPEPVVVHERQGWRHVAAGMAIDVVSRWQGRRAGEIRHVG
jgi:8-oxo-dGTP pyrophosphatase MutT (NUDIX family)